MPRPTIAIQGSMSDGSIEDSIDCEGLLCPLPVLRARKRLNALPPGAVLAVRATDPMAAIDLTHFCAQHGHSLLSSQADGVVTVYRIRRGA